MSVPIEKTSGLSAPAARPIPKPYSIERRFRLMQSGTLVLAILLFSTALYLGAAYQSRLAISIASLHVVGQEAQRLQALSEQMRETWRQMLIVLIAFAAFSIGVSIWFRRAHQRHIWQHLEELGQLVAEVRRGNLNITAEIPQSVEFAPLMEAFVEMAAELAEMRASLERKVIERTAKLELAQKELLQSAKLASLGQLVSGVAHEINNPLTAILGFTEVVLGRPGIDAATLPPLRTIREEALRLKNVVANLSTFARRAPHRTQRLDVRTIIDRLVELREYHLRADNITLHVTRPPDSVWITADPDQLLQVLLNLLLNSEQAIRDARDRGDIWIDCRVDGARASLTIRDNGTGMTPHVQERIFEPFFTTKPPGKGTGLGLAISHGIVQQHNGKIFVETKMGEGTVVRIELPVSNEQPVTQSSSNAAPKPAQAPSVMRHALVIDDERGILEMVGDALERIGCRVTLLHGSAEVEAALQKDHFDVVLCDLKMPGQSGLDIYRLLCSKYSPLSTRFLLMTGNLADAQEHSDELASVPILPKPFTLVRLREAVTQLLAK